MESKNELLEIFETHQALALKQKYESLLQTLDFIKQIDKAIEKYGVRKVQQADPYKLLDNSYYDFDFFLFQNRNQLKEYVGEEEFDRLATEYEVVREKIKKFHEPKPLQSGGFWFPIY